MSKYIIVLASLFPIAKYTSRLINSSPSAEMIISSPHKFLDCIHNFHSQVSKTIEKLFQILKTWFLISLVLCIFAVISSLIYCLIYHIIMPVPYQHSIISMYKSQDSLIGLTEQEITLQNENYLISVNLQVPEDETNISIGNFEIELTFRYKNGQIKKLKNLGILKYYSYYTKIIKNLVKLPFVLLGIYDESQVVTVKFYHSLLHAEEIEKVFIKIVPQELRIYSMSIDFEVRLEGIRNFMYAHGYYSFFIAAGGIFCMLCGFFIMMTALNYEWIWKNQEMKENEIKDTRVKEDNETCASSEDACPCPQEIEFQFASIIKQMPEKPWYKF